MESQNIKNTQIYQATNSLKRLLNNLPILHDISIQFRNESNINFDKYPHEINRIIEFISVHCDSDPYTLLGEKIFLKSEEINDLVRGLLHNFGGHINDSTIQKIKEICLLLDDLISILDYLPIVYDAIQKSLNSNELNLELDFFKNSFAETKEENSILKAELVKRRSEKTNINFQRSSDKYEVLAKKYRKLFYGSIFVFPALSVSTVLFKNTSPFFIGLSFSDTSTDYWSIKISIILIGVTLISYFLKMSSHYQKLAEQNHQKHTELDALPDFIGDLTPEDIRDIKKELAPKYFGREVDGTTHKDMSNLISDQMKNAAELVKASAEVVKSINQPATKPIEPSKPKDTDTK